MNNQTVLLVEDNEDDVELTLRSFQKHKLSNKVVVTHNGQEALDYLFARGAFAQRSLLDLPVLILLDLKLPKINGLDVLREIRANPSTKYIPVVVLTTSSQQSDKTQSYDRGANSYVRKPVDFDQFLEVTRQLGIYWLMVNDPPPMTQVLMIEDNTEDVELAQRAFEKIKLLERVRIIRDGTEALDYLLGRGPFTHQGPATSIKLVLLDLGLPKTSGLEVLSQIRMNPPTRHLPVVVMTVSKKEPDLLQSFAMGVSDYLIKPLDPDRFAQMYKKYVSDHPK